MSDSLLDSLIHSPSGLAGLVAARAPRATLGWRHGGAVSHAEFLARMRAWAALLRRQDGRDFALYLDDSIEFGAALLGAWQAGKTVWLSTDTLAASCAALRASVCGFLGEFPDSCAPLRPTPDDERAGAADHSAPCAPAPDAVALVVHTSGSTGAAQAIPKRWSQLGSEVATLEASFGARIGAAAVVATVSHQHIYGLLFKVLWPLAAGRPLHAISLQFPEQLAAVLAAGPGVLIASPAHLKRLPEHLAWDAAAPGLRAAFSSGGPLGADVAKACGALLGQAPIEVYGSSETGGVAWRQRRLDGADDESWLAFPGVAWRLAAPDGLLEVRSDLLADANWLRLADRAQASGLERFLLLGRSDRIVKIEEKRVSLDALEAALAASDLAEQARVVLCPAEGAAREVLAAFVVASGAGRALLAERGKLALNRALRAALGDVAESVALPRRWRYIEHMPQDAQGKTTHAGLLALLDDEPAQELAKAAANAPAPTRPAARLLEQEPRRVLLELCAPANLLYFDGHFPGAPILPGVVQADWAIAYGRQYFALPPRFLGMSALKFQNVIRPGQAVRLELLHDVAKGRINFRYLSELGQHAGGRILFGPDNATSPTTAKGAC
jgi:acyl-coenzyme A synthetase/AMP-(fatty) acid ligase